MTVTQVHLAVATRLAQTGVGVFSPTGVYTKDQTGITLKSVPQAPDRIIAVTVYDIDDEVDPNLPRRTYLVQVRFRAGTYPTDVDDIADAAEAALAVDHQTWASVRVERCYRTSVAPLGADANNRHERTDNYRLVVQQ